MQTEQKVSTLKHYVRTCVSKLCERNRWGSYNNKLVCARGGGYGAGGKALRRGGIIVQEARGREMVEKLKENHIFGEFENIIRVVGRRLKKVRVWCWRTRLPDALRVGIVPACPVHSGILERSEGRHGPEGIRKLLVKRWIKMFIQRDDGH